MTGRMIGRYTEAALLKRAKEVVEEKGSGSAIFDEEAEKVIPRFYAKGECDISCVSTLYCINKLPRTAFTYPTCLFQSFNSDQSFSWVKCLVGEDFALLVKLQH